MDARNVRAGHPERVLEDQVTPYYSDDTTALYHCDWRELVGIAGQVDALITDCPYSERTHAGHDGEAAADEGATWVRANGRREKKIARREIAYTAWCATDVDAFVDAWSPSVGGWMVSLTDDVLFKAWRAAMDRVGRMTFQDVPAVIRGMGVRLVGDGPSSWAIHCAVARPRTKTMASWGTLDGGYSGPSEPQPCVGGKPLWLMRALVRDYSRPGDLVCDPCCGAGTTLLAAKLEGRRGIGSDINEAHLELAANRLSHYPRERKGQLALLGGDS
jgi:tRNA G10  N-methylase Trm11